MNNLQEIFLEDFVPDQIEPSEHVISVVTANVSPTSSPSTDVEATFLSSSTKGKRHRLTRADEKTVLEAYSSGIPLLELMSIFTISKTQLTRILSDGFQKKKIQPVSPRYHLLKNTPQYSAFFEFLGCSSAPFLKCERIGNALNITAYGKDGV